MSAPSSKATTPMSMLPGCAAINDRAARCAAASRSGATSLAPMLLDTSMATMIVPDSRGTGSDAAGPATAIASTAMPAIVSHTPAGPARPGDARRRQGRGPPSEYDDGTAGQGRGDEQADGEQRGRGEGHARLR